MIKKILSILDHGLAITDIKLHTKFSEDFHDNLVELRRSQNAEPEDYFDSDVDINTEKLTDYMEAYDNILKNINTAK